MESCWAENIYLSALASQFVKLSLQLASRYKTWVEQGLVQSETYHPLMKSQSEPKLQPDQSKQPFEPKLQPDQSKQTVENEVSSLAHFGLRDWVCVVFDLDKLSTTYITAHFFEHAKPRLNFCPEDLIKLVKGFFFFLTLFLCFIHIFCVFRVLLTNSKIISGINPIGRKQNSKHHCQEMYGLFAIGERNYCCIPYDQ